MLHRGKATSNIKSTLKHEINEFFENMDENCKKTNIYKEVCEITEQTLIREALKKTKKNQIKAAELLGINRNTLKSKINKFEIK